MTRKTARDFDPEVLQLFDKYVHGDLSRRGFLQSAGKLAAGALSAEALLAALSPDFAQAQQVAPSDPRIVGSRVDFPSPDGNGKVHGYLVRPAAAIRYALLSRSAAKSRVGPSSPSASGLMMKARAVARTTRSRQFPFRRSSTSSTRPAPSSTLR